jgi:hypothetical protein
MSSRMCDRMSENQSIEPQHSNWIDGSAQSTLIYNCSVPIEAQALELCAGLVHRSSITEGTLPRVERGANNAKVTGSTPVWIHMAVWLWNK